LAPIILNIVLRFNNWSISKDC